MFLKKKKKKKSTTTKERKKKRKNIEKYRQLDETYTMVRDESPFLVKMYRRPLSIRLLVCQSHETFIGEILR